MREIIFEFGIKFNEHMEQQKRNKRKVEAPAEVQEEDSQMQEEEDEFRGPTPVSELEKCGIAQGDIKKMADAGYNTVESICFTPRKALIEIKGISDAKLDKILEAA